MNDINNPFFNLAEGLSKQKNTNAIQSIGLGKVLSEDPLLIKYNDIQLDRDDLIINRNFINYKFNINSQVLLLTTDNQKFILVCEVY